MSGNSNFSKELLKVEFDKLSELSTYLTNADFDEKIQRVSGEVSKLDESWFDLDGAEFKDEFTKFLNHAKEINKGVVELGEFAAKMVGQYQDTVESYSKKIAESYDK